MRKRFEVEFLLRLAPVWLAARYRIMGGSLRRQDGWPKQDLTFDMLGCMDYRYEMKLACREALRPSADEASDDKEGVWRL